MTIGRQLVAWQRAILFNSQSMRSVIKYPTSVSVLFYGGIRFLGSREDRMRAYGLSSQMHLCYLVNWLWEVIILGPYHSIISSVNTTLSLTRQRRVMSQFKSYACSIVYMGVNFGKPVIFNLFISRKKWVFVHLDNVE